MGTHWGRLDCRSVWVSSVRSLKSITHLRFVLRSLRLFAFVTSYFGKQNRYEIAHESHSFSTLHTSSLIFPDTEILRLRIVSSFFKFQKLQLNLSPSPFACVRVHINCFLYFEAHSRVLFVSLNNRTHSLSEKFENTKFSPSGVLATEKILYFGLLLLLNFSWLASVHLKLVK